ncbi:unnamed protein product, partial [Gulo gulo]
APRWLQGFLYRIEEESRQCEGREWAPSSGWINPLIPRMLAAQIQGSCLPEILQVSLPRKNPAAGDTGQSRLHATPGEAGKVSSQAMLLSKRSPVGLRVGVGSCCGRRGGARTTVLDISLPRPQNLHIAGMVSACPNPGSSIQMLSSLELGLERTVTQETRGTPAPVPKLRPTFSAWCLLRGPTYSCVVDGRNDPL